MTKILVVEDEGILALDICQELSSLGYQIAGHCASGEEAVKMAQAARPDIIFMDINLQGEMDGIEAAAQIQASFDVLIIFLTAHAEERTLQRAKSVQPAGYIIKPFEKDELRVTIELALSRRNTLQAENKLESEDLLAKIPEVELQGMEGRLELFLNHPLFNKLPKSSLEALARNSLLKSLAAGEAIVLEGDEISAGFMVISGRLSVVKCTDSGKELTMELLSPGEITGYLMAYENGNPAYTVRAQVDSKVLTTPVKELKAVLKSNPELYEELLSRLSERLRAFGDLALSLAHTRVEKRIVSTLLALAPRVGKTAPSEKHVRLFITRKELADLTGTTPETAIRITKALEREGLLDLARPGIIKIPSLDNLRQNPLRS